MSKKIIRLCERRVIGKKDEELAAVGIGAAIGHCHPALVIATPHLFVIELITGATRAGPFRVAGLYHKAGYHAMEDQSIVEVVLRQEDEVVHRDGGVLWIKFDDNQSAIGI